MREMERVNVMTRVFSENPQREFQLLICLPLHLYLRSEK